MHRCRWGVPTSCGHAEPVYWRVIKQRGGVGWGKKHGGVVYCDECIPREVCMCCALLSD